MTDFPYLLTISIEIPKVNAFSIVTYRYMIIGHEKPRRKKNTSEQVIQL